MLAHKECYNRPKLLIRTGETREEKSAFLKLSFLLMNTCTKIIDIFSAHRIDWTNLIQHID